ncbi:hypothetical protein VpasPP24_58 [Vibrio phage Vpas_PP24]|nr:hypothetical protein VpasPP24_58 [Vibrio phage Vpas_PP24]
MILASISELRQRLNVKDSEQYNRILASVLTTVTMRIGEHLKADFDKETKENVFLATPANHLVSGALGRSTTSSGVLSLWLDGFNVSDVELRICDDINASGVLTNSIKVDSKGIVKIYDGWVDYDYFKVSFNSGFDIETIDDYPTYVGVPDKLKQACLMYAEHFFMAKYANGDVDEDDNEDYTDAPNGVSALLYSLSRSPIGCLTPIL